MDIKFDNVVNITSSEILNKITNYQIYRYYLKQDFELGKAINSPFREDKIPSFNIYQNINGELKYKDMANIAYSGNCFTFVMQLFNINYGQALNKIYNDFHLSEYDPATSPFNTNSLSFIGNTSNTSLYGNGSEKKVIDIKKQPFSYVDFIYWKGFGLDIDLLQKFNVSVARSVYVNQRIVMEYHKYNPIYAYEFNNCIKIYRPLELNRKYKWLFTNDKDTYQGYEQLQDTGELLIITKSLKDVMVLYTLGFQSISPNSENASINPEFIDKLFKRFDNIILLYDNDNAGILASDTICKRLNLCSVSIPIDSKCKDIAEYRQRYGEVETVKMINKIIYNK